MAISDERRREVAKELRGLDVSDLGDRGNIIDTPEEEGDLFSRILEVANDYRPGLHYAMSHFVARDAVELFADLIEPQTIDGDTSDGYHTFNELYHHRAVLFSVIVAKFADRAWKSKLHADGTMYEGMFIVGIETPDGQATYHYDVDPYWEMFRCKETDRAPEWDGHTPDQAIERIGKLVDCETDRPTCKNIADPYDGSFFECSKCGERWEFSCGSPADNHLGFCPRCGAEVVS